MSEPDHNYVSAIFTNLIEPIAGLYQRLLRCGSDQPNQVQTSPIENGYAVAIVALVAFIIEGACGRVRYVSGWDKRRTSVDTLRDLNAGDLANDVEEIFVVRDVAAHAHLWTASVSWNENGLQFQDSPKKLLAYGDKKFKRCVDSRSRVTRRLRLDVFPPRICKHTATVTLKKCIEVLRVLETLDRRFVYLTPVHVRIDGKFVRFYKWVEKLTV